MRLLCKVMQVGKTSYYEYLKKQRSPQLDQKLLQEEVAAIKEFKDSKGCYGTRRISKSLKRNGLMVGRYRARTIMKKHNLKVKTKKQYKVTTNSNHNKHVSPNLVQQHFSATEPNKIWLGDITYVWTSSGWLYLAAVLDIYSRRLIGWGMGTRMNEDLVSSALKMAYSRRSPGNGCIFHTDRGSQYASQSFRKLLNKYGMRQSMSGKGNCYDNAPMERFFSSLKREETELLRFSNQI